MTTLYICEKPSQARDIARVLGIHKKDKGFISGKDIIVTWCLGHLLELCPPDEYCKDLKPWRMEVLPVIPEEWKLTVKPKTKDQFNVIKKLLKKASNVIIATDADREGDVIGREILDMCHYQGPVERLWLSALDDASIKKALVNIRTGDSTINLYQAGLGRQRADWLIGMNMTMAMSCLHSQKGEGALTVGRVQTPTLNLVVNRDNEIENFIPKDYFELFAIVESSKGAFKVKWFPDEDFTDEEGRCLNYEAAKTCSDKLANSEATVEQFKNEYKKISPPLCFSLSKLQQIASSQFGYSAQQTLEIAQSLYEKYKATTYPRTDCGYLPIEQLSDAKTILNSLSLIMPELGDVISGCDVTYQSPTWNSKKITAHHGIIPTTNCKIDIDSMTEAERNLYELIIRYYIAQFLHEYEYEQRKIVILAEDYQFQANCAIPVVPGWKVILNYEPTKDENTVIPILDNGCSCFLRQTNIETKQTKALPRYTEGTLISAMKNIAKFIDDKDQKKLLRETSGIGTESTRASIIEKLINKKYLMRQKKQLISTTKGRKLIGLLPEAIKSASTTAMWEKALEDIAVNRNTLETFLLDQHDFLECLLEQTV